MTNNVIVGLALVCRLNSGIVSGKGGFGLASDGTTKACPQGHFSQELPSVQPVLVHVIYVRWQRDASNGDSLKVTHWTWASPLRWGHVVCK
jgi:hypothetical protein